MEGLFAINKPAGISSAQVIREVQAHFNPSKLFAPWIAAEKSRRSTEAPRSRSKKWNKQPVQVKIGHGGTLDPGATGVLILGVGSGTKQLSQFLHCTKTYETVVLFGATTDTYDALGKVVGRNSCEDLSEQRVSETLEIFRGDIMQRPPIFSALHLDGKRLYEYAREGKELPREIEKRPVRVDELELVEWMGVGTHDYKIPEQEAPVEEKAMANKVLQLDPNNSGAGAEDCFDQQDKKRKRGAEDHASNAPASKEIRESNVADVSNTKAHDDFETDQSNVNEVQHPSEISNRSTPAIKLRVTSSSGFYVRSLCHDLGQAVGSLGLMAHLVRTRQGQFELGKNVFEFEDFAKGEELWGPKIRTLLETPSLG